jgi:hypothetical protein
MGSTLPPLLLLFGVITLLRSYMLINSLKAPEGSRTLSPDTM